MIWKCRGHIVGESTKIGAHLVELADQHVSPLRYESLGLMIREVIWNVAQVLGK